MQLTTTSHVLIALSLLQGVACFAPQIRAIQTFETRRCVHQSASFADHALSVAATAAALRGQTVVVKYGGNAMTSPELALGFCQDVAALQKLGIRVVVVHGGGPQISSMLEKVGVDSRFEGGFRVSTSEVVDIAEMVLCGSVNKGISSAICGAGGRAIGLSGRDDSLLQCTKQISEEGYDLGFVGVVETVNTNLLNQLLDIGITPVVSPIGTGIGDQVNIAFNVNADTAAGRIAGELKAARVLFLTDIAGVLDKEKNLLRHLSVDQIQALIDNETITGGMIPKVQYATSAVQLGVASAFITDGRVPHALLNQILGDGSDSQGGTIVTL
jgi:acetylglutamate kinase